LKSHVLLAEGVLLATKLAAPRLSRLKKAWAGEHAGSVIKPLWIYLSEPGRLYGDNQRPEKDFASTLCLLEGTL
jgi:hypothetical protein